MTAHKWILTDPENLSPEIGRVARRWGSGEQWFVCTVCGTEAYKSRSGQHVEVFEYPEGVDDDISESCEEMSVKRVLYR